MKIIHERPATWSRSFGSEPKEKAQRPREVNNLLAVRRPHRRDIIVKYSTLHTRTSIAAVSWYDPRTSTQIVSYKIDHTSG